MQKLPDFQIACLVKKFLGLLMGGIWKLDLVSTMGDVKEHGEV